MNNWFFKVTLYSPFTGSFARYKFVTCLFLANVKTVHLCHIVAHTHTQTEFQNYSECVGGHAFSQSR